MKWWGFLHSNGRVEVYPYKPKRDAESVKLAASASVVNELTIDIEADRRMEAMKIIEHKLIIKGYVRINGNSKKWKKV